MWIMTGDQDVAIHSAKPVADPIRGIVGLQIPRCGEICKRVTRTPERFGGLPRTQLATVPHDSRVHASRCRLGGETADMFASVLGERAPGIDVGPDGVPVMYQEEFICRTPFPRPGCVPSCDFPAVESDTS